MKFYLISDNVDTEMGLRLVGIQVLRLEFYEMFSRYYEGNGIPFKTIKED